MKLKGKHSSLKLILFLSAVSLATVGFSAWIINGSITDANTTISFSVGDDMDFSVKYTVTSGIPFNSTSGNVNISYTYSKDFDGIKGLSNSNGKQFIDTSCLNVANYTLDGTTTSFGNSAITVKYNENKTIATVTHTWTFKWGSAFNSDNPCNITSDPDGAYAESLRTFVSAAKTAMTSKTFTITITPSFTA